MSDATTDLLRALLCGVLCWVSVPVAADLDARLAIGSGYVHRGLEHSRGAAVLQGAIQYQGEAGWVAGLWASTLDFGAYDSRTSELDYYLGFSRRVAPLLALDASVVRYTFQNASAGHASAWNELQLSAYLGERWSLTWGVADGGWVSDERTRFAEATFRSPLPQRLILDATAGYQLAERALGLDYGYLEAGLSRSWRELVLRLGYSVVDPDARRRFPGFAYNHWVVSLTWQR